MIPELAAQYAARASGAAISKTTIKKITLVLNRRTQRRERAILFQLSLLDQRTHTEKRAVPCRKKTALPRGNAASI
jgi:repressor of nif and glnA expression